MADMFPDNAGISEMRAVIKIIKENDKSHSITLAKLARESKKDIKDLLSIIEVSKLLGLTSVYDGEIRLTREGNKLNIGNFQEVIRKGITRAEPFKTSVQLLSSAQPLTTKGLARLLVKHRGIVLHGDEKQNEQMLRYLFLKWAVRCQIMNYDARTDMWSAKQKHN